MRVLWLLPWVLVYVNPTTLEATEIGRYETEAQCRSFVSTPCLGCYYFTAGESSFCEFRPELIQEP